MLPGVGFGELAVICIILILAIGPERMPQAMRTVGKTLRTLRQASRDIRSATGIDELLREDLLDGRPAVRRPAPPVGPAVNRLPEPPPAEPMPTEPMPTEPMPTEPMPNQSSSAAPDPAVANTAGIATTEPAPAVTNHTPDGEKLSGSS